MRSELIDLILCNHRLAVLAKPQFHLRLRKRNPQLPPGPEFHIRRENILHLLTRIPLRQRAHISVCPHVIPSSTFPACYKLSLSILAVTLLSFSISPVDSAASGMKVFLRRHKSAMKSDTSSHTPPRPA